MAYQIDDRVSQQESTLQRRWKHVSELSRCTVVFMKHLVSGKSPLETPLSVDFTLSLPYYGIILVKDKQIANSVICLAALLFYQLRYNYIVIQE